MLYNAYQAKDDSFHWVDVVDPTGTELETLYKKYDLHQISIQDFLDPKHLPKYEHIEDQQFIILRSYDDKSKATANTIRELTRKLAIFVGSNFILTIHRRELPYIVQIRERWIKNQKEDEHLSDRLLEKIFQSVIMTYNQGLQRCENDLERFEAMMFKNEISSLSIREKFFLKRKAFLFKRLLKLTHDILPKLKSLQEYDPPAFQDLKEKTESALFEAEDILEYVSGLISLHLSLASHKTNEVIRVLTLFSVFFLPLTFIVGVYGMNFEHMPELKWEYGYYFSIVLMFLVCIILFAWFRRRGFLK